MIDVYGMSTPNAVKITILLEELGLPYRQHHVNVFAGEQHASEFLRISPNNKVPVIVDADGPDGTALPVFESGAILIYLAEKSGRLLPARGAARTSVLEWLMVQLTGVGPMFGQLVHFTRYAPAGNDYGVNRYTSEVRRLLRRARAAPEREPPTSGVRSTRSPTSPPGPGSAPLPASSPSSRRRPRRATRSRPGRRSRPGSAPSGRARRSGAASPRASASSIATAPPSAPPMRMPSIASSTAASTRAKSAKDASP